MLKLIHSQFLVTALLFSFDLPLIMLRIILFLFEREQIVVYVVAEQDSHGFKAEILRQYIPAVDYKVQVAALRAYYT